MSDTPLWLDAFPHDYAVAHERTLHGMSKVRERVYYPGARRDGGHDGAWLRITSASGRVWTGVFTSEIHLRMEDLLHRVSLRTGRTVAEPAPW